jgi:NitT/TauT family transport system ATP-binding protein
LTRGAASSSTPALPTSERAARIKVSIRGVGKSFRRGRSFPAVEALAGASLDIAEESFVGLLGPSGCGKTTLLRMIDGLVEPDTGTILVDGRKPRPGPAIGFVFQSFRLIPWRTVRGNVGFALEQTAMPAGERAERVERYLSAVGLARFADAYPAELSGGMKQRAALARALAPEPGLLLMDEPFASIDAQTRELMQGELMRLFDRQRTTVLFVTHSVDEAILLSDRIVLMSPRPGRVVESVDVPLPRPRFDYDARATPVFAELRAHLWARIRDMVMSDPTSDFFARPGGA